MLLEFFILNKLQIAAALLPLPLTVGCPSTTLRVQSLVVPCITFFAAMFSLLLSLSRWVFFYYLIALFWLPQRARRFFITFASSCSWQHRGLVRHV